jgi:hypothetical protein
MLLCRLVGLPASTTFEDLLGKTAAATAKKGAMKTAAGASGGAGASRMGQVKKVTASHLADGQKLQLEIQVCTPKTFMLYAVMLFKQLLQFIGVSCRACLAPACRLKEVLATAGKQLSSHWSLRCGYIV